MKTLPDKLRYPPERGSTLDAIKREDAAGKAVLITTTVVLSPLLFVAWLFGKKGK